MNPWVMPRGGGGGGGGGGAKGRNLWHPNKVVYCILFIQTTSY